MKKIALLVEKFKFQKAHKNYDEALYVICRQSSSAISWATKDLALNLTNNVNQGDNNTPLIGTDNELQPVLQRTIEIDLFFQKMLHQIVLNIYLDRKTMHVLPGTKFTAKNINTNGTVLQNKLWLRKYEHKKFIPEKLSPIDNLEDPETIEEQICTYAIGQIAKSIQQAELNILKNTINDAFKERAEIITVHFLSYYKSILLSSKKNVSYKKKLTR